MYTRTRVGLAACATLAVLGLAAPVGASAYTFTSIDDPAATGDTIASDINNNGEIVGYYEDTTRNPRTPDYHGFTLVGTTFTTLDNPGAVRTFATSVNDSGTVVGISTDPPSTDPNSQVPETHGFTEKGGAFTTFNDPRATGSGGGTFANGINTGGTVVGYETDNLSNNPSSFTYNGTTFTRIVNPNARFGTFAYGINASGEVVGDYRDSSDAYHGFTMVGTTFTTLDDPLAAPGSFNIVTGVNDSGEVIGSFDDASGTSFGYVYDGKTFTTLADPLGPDSTSLNGINDAGQIVGNYTDAAGNTHGFLATPAPEPSSWAAFGFSGLSLAVLMLKARRRAA